jgi:Uma2 family endonuclease
MNWQEVCEHPSLQNLPFKIELNEKGQIVMSPVKVIHSFLQGKIEQLIRMHLKDGEAMPEYAVRTAKGTKVVDVAWISADRLRSVIRETESPIAPEICVEIFSESNTEAEMAEKRLLYFEKGALECWICSESGEISFFDPEGPLPRSSLIPAFPKTIDIAKDFG